MFELVILIPNISGSNRPQKSHHKMHLTQMYRSVAKKGSSLQGGGLRNVLKVTDATLGLHMLFVVFSLFSLSVC